MFCIKCGCRIPLKATKCPDCGADLPVMEYCGGFWTELNQNTQTGAGFEERDVREAETDIREENAGTSSDDTVETIPETGVPGDSTPAQDRESGPERKTAGRKRPVLAWAAAVLFLLLAASVCFNILQKRQLTEKDETLQEAQSEQEALREENNRLLGEYASLQVQYTVRTMEKEIRNAVRVIAGGMFEKPGENDPEAEDSGTAETGGTDTQEAGPEMNGTDTQEAGPEMSGSDTEEPSEEQPNVEEPPADMEPEKPEGEEV